MKNKMTFVIATEVLSINEIWFWHIYYKFKVEILITFLSVKYFFKDLVANGIYKQVLQISSGCVSVLLLTPCFQAFKDSVHHGIVIALYLVYFGSSDIEVAKKVLPISINTIGATMQ